MATRFDNAADKLSRAITGNPTTYTMAWWGILSVTSAAYRTFGQFKYGVDSFNGGLGTDSGGVNPIIYSGGEFSGVLGNLTVGRWYHWILERNGTSLKAYRNGVLDISVTVAGTFNTIFLGNNDGGEHLNGCVEHAFCWRRLLSQAEKEAQMYSAVPVSWEALDGWHPMEDAGKSRDDLSGFGRRLTLAGTLTTQDASPAVAPAPRWRRGVSYSSGGAPPASFQAAWARYANVVLQPGRAA